MSEQSDPPPDGWKHTGVRVIPGDALDDNTPQTPGMHRATAIDRARVGAQKLWAGTVHIHAGAKTGPHHHGHSETGIYVVSGSPAFVFREGDDIVRLQTAPGDYIYVPPHVPHLEENSGAGDAVVVIARNTQESIVVNLDQL